MMRQPKDFDTMANPSTLWSTTDGRTDMIGAEAGLEFGEGNLHLTVFMTVNDNEYTDAGTLTAEAVAELRDQLDAWLKWAGHDRRCEHTIGLYRPYCAEMVCHNYAGRHAHKVDE